MMITSPTMIPPSSNLFVVKLTQIPRTSLRVTPRSYYFRTIGKKQVNKKPQTNLFRFSIIKKKTFLKIIFEQINIFWSTKIIFEQMIFWPKTKSFFSK